jgi:hypothetical protein
MYVEMFIRLFYWFSYSWVFISSKLISINWNRFRQFVDIFWFIWILKRNDEKALDFAQLPKTRRYRILPIALLEFHRLPQLAQGVSMGWQGFQGGNLGKVGGTEAWQQNSSRLQTKLEVGDATSTRRQGSHRFNLKDLV